jgi:hypothetical protein
MAQGLTHSLSTPPTASDQAQEMSAASPTGSGSLTLISDLPAELLQLIFGYCTEFEDPTIGLYRTCPSWVYVTHVCSHWRTTALNCSSLWTLINTNTTGNRWIKAFLERYKASLINVTFNLASYSYTNTPWSKPFLDLNEFIALFTGCTRLRSLHITGELNVVYKLLDALHTATHIRSLSLDIDFGLLWIPHVNLPENLFRDRRPSVRCALSHPAISSHRGGFFAASPSSHPISGYPSEFCSIPCAKCLYSTPSRWNAASQIGKAPTRTTCRTFKFRCRTSCISQWTSTQDHPLFSLSSTDDSLYRMALRKAYVPITV